MAKRQRDTRAEYAARKAREAERGFSSPRQGLKARREARADGVKEPTKLSAEQLRNHKRYISEARRISKKLDPNSPVKFDESKAGDVEYAEKWHRWAQLYETGGVTAAERKRRVVALLAANYGMDYDDYADLFDGDGGSTPE